MDDELVYYRQVVSELCDKCQVFDEWFLHLQEQMDKDGELFASLLLCIRRPKIAFCYGLREGSA